MKIYAITFISPWQAELKEKEFNIDNLGDKGILIDTEYSIISAGTELAILSGNEGWAPLPYVPGYGSIGKIRKVGKAVEGFKDGDRIFNYGPHQSVTIAGGLILPVPETLDPKLAVIARIAQVSYTSVRVSNAEIGDTVAVIGLGLVGNIAAQLFTIMGCRVIGIDVSDKRLAIARSCGILHTINASKSDLLECVRDITTGNMCETVIEATGIPDQVLTAAKITGKNGEVVLLGSPRGKFKGDTVELLNTVHIWGNCVTLKGAHEWRYPLYHDKKGFNKHSIERNLRQIFDFMLSGKLNAGKLVTHVIEPSHCSEVYTNLRNRNEEFFGVVFDWNRIGGKQVL